MDGFRLGVLRLVGSVSEEKTLVKGFKVHGLTSRGLNQ